MGPVPGLDKQIDMFNWCSICWGTSLLTKQIPAWLCVPAGCSHQALGIVKRPEPGTFTPTPNLSSTADERLLFIEHPQQPLNNDSLIVGK